MRHVMTARRTVCWLLLSIVSSGGLLGGIAHGDDEQKAAKNDWPNFRNGLEQRGIATTTLPEKPELLWKHEAGEMVTATAAIVDGRVYIGTLKGEVLCLDLKNGERIWTYRSIESDDPEEFAPGFNAAATVSGDTVYLGDEEGVFHAINRQDGKERWKFQTNDQIVGAAAVVGEHVIVGSHDQSLYCLKTATGEKVWEVVTEGPVNCSVAVEGNSTFTTGCDGLLRVIDITTGKENIELQQQVGSYVIASPAVMGDLLYVGNHDAEFWAVDWKNGKHLWTYKAERRHYPFHSSAAVTDDLVVVGNGDKRLHCIDRATGKGRWMFDTRGAVDGSPVVVGDRVYFGSGDGKLYGVNLADGKEVFRFVGGRPFTASPAVGEGCLVIGSESSKGYIYCFGTKPAAQ